MLLDCIAKEIVKIDGSSDRRQTNRQADTEYRSERRDDVKADVR